jgi:hypothetical protein
LVLGSASSIVTTSPFHVRQVDQKEQQHYKGQEEGRRNHSSHDLAGGVHFFLFPSTRVSSRKILINAKAKRTLCSVAKHIQNQ